MSRTKFRPKTDGYAFTNSWIFDSTEVAKLTEQWMAVLHLAVLVSASFVVLGLTVSRPAAADVGSCLSLAYSAADPRDVEKAASFAAHHSECLQDLEPPVPLIPYAALSESLDAANQSGALGKVGLAFGDSYDTCVAKFDLGKVVLKQLEPVLKPVCGTIHLDCDIFEQQAGSEANAQIVNEVPLLGLLPCACAAATSGLGVTKIKELLNKAESCGGTLADAGKAVVGVAKGVYKAAETVGCAVESLWGGCSSDDPPPPPPDGISAAADWCAPYGGIQSAQSRTNRPDDFSVVCNDGSKCTVAPGKTPRCATAAQIKQYEQQQAVHDAALRQSNTLWCQQKSGVWRTQYEAQCHDAQCRTEVDGIVAEYVNETLAEANGPRPFPANQIASLYAKKYLDRFDDAIDGSIARDPKSGFQTVLTAYSCKWFLGREGEELCPTQHGYEACKRFVDTNLVRVCLQAGQANSKYANKLMDDPNADPTVRMGLYGCKNFLGRTGEKLCDQQKGFEICKQAADRGLVKECISSQTQEKYQPGVRTAAHLTGSPEQWLPEHQCKYFLGRHGQWICPNTGGYDVCLEYLASDAVDVCTAPSVPRRISRRFLEEELGHIQCVPTWPHDGPIVVRKTVYLCPDARAVADCEKLKPDFAGGTECQVRR